MRTNNENQEGAGSDGAGHNLQALTDDSLQARRELLVQRVLAGECDFPMTNEELEAENFWDELPEWDDSKE